MHLELIDVPKSCTCCCSVIVCTTTYLSHVTRSLYKEWENCYENITQMVVPRSTNKVAEDSEYGLYTVTVFRKVADEFKHHAREKKLSIGV